MKYDWSDKNKFFNNWSNSKNICDFLRKNNLTPTSGNYFQFKKWYRIHNVGLENIPKDVFIKNSIHNRKTVKKLIKKYNLLPYQCNCGITDVWNNKPITLQLEHKNGISNDHRIENLEYLCPNCHSQTQSYSGSNISSKVLEKRLPLLLKNKELTRKVIKILSEEWKITYESAYTWIKNNIVKINEHDIEIKFLKTKDLSISSKKFLLKTMERKEELSKEIVSFEELNRKWGIKNSKSWIKKNLPEKYELFKEKSIENKKIIQSEKLNIIPRTQDALALTNKKQLPKLAKQWGISVTAVKKWIRNNLPEHFDAIFDDALLVKNQKAQIWQAKHDAIAQLNHDSFNLDEFMSQYNIKTKASAYSLIKAHNLELYEKLMPDVVCIYCTGKTRTAGQSGGKTRYRCLDCDKSFTRLLEIS
jgi:transposase-like protein